MKVDRYCGKPRLGNQMLPIHSWFISPNARVVREVFGADGLVNETISCIANLNFSRCKGLLQKNPLLPLLYYKLKTKILFVIIFFTYLIPISRCISVSLRALIIAPLLTFARHAATYQAGIPTQSSSQATIVGPFHKAKGVPAFIASASNSCREESSILLCKHLLFITILTQSNSKHFIYTFPYFTN